MEDWAIQKGMHEEQHTSILFGLPSVTPLTACRAALLAAGAAADTVRVGTDCSVCSDRRRTGPGVRLDKKRIHDTRHVGFLASEWDNLGRTGRSGRGAGLRTGRRRKSRRGVRRMVQCLIGPLLWVTESEISKKAERMTLKDLSQRDDTSSDVIPFVSIFGRIFNLMVPVEVKKK